MGDCDRMKKHISDYLDRSLDPTTKNEFERILGENLQLRSMTENTGRVRHLLTNLSSVQCSDEFNVRLRERILQTQKTPRRDPVRRYALTASFAAIFILAVVLINPFASDESGNLPELPATSVQSPAAAGTQSKYNSGVNTPTSASSTTQRDIKTLDEAKAYSDSATEQKIPELKHVDRKEVKQTQP